ncbi:hypothetical protein HW555_000155 [Spodoptera exigua]|uniref:Uncharacterized protein n=1 Tax=Spodoptera exigua TaxID=7107 RepID=A0A835LCE8_SPOEX|nr:hypothetical protein HW555_000155 [Spodoptera exigua]
MHSTLFFVASLALLALCVCAPADQDVIQHIPLKPEQTPSVTGKEDAVSGASGKVAGASEHVPQRARRDVAGQESDLLPAINDVDVSPFGETSQLEGRGRIRVLPAYLVTSLSVLETTNEQGVSNITVLEVNQKTPEDENAELVTKRDINTEDNNMSDLNDDNKEIFEAAESSNLVSDSYEGISPVHDFKEKLVGNSKGLNEKFLLTSPHNALKHLDNSILKATKNVTQSPEMNENLYQISKDIVSAILSKLEIQDKITRITREALEAPGKNKGITAIETRRILDYISRTLSGHILSITRASTEPELHRLVYGLAQIAAEVSIVSALKDTTYPAALSKKQSVDLSLRRKRAISSGSENALGTPPPTATVAISNTNPNKSTSNTTDTLSVKQLASPYSILFKNDKKPVHVLSTKQNKALSTKGFLNQTALDLDNKEQENNNTDPILIQKSINGTHYVKESQTLDTQELTAPGLIDDWMDNKETVYKPINPEVVADMEIDQPEFDDDVTGNEKRTKQKQERLEVKAKKAILYAGDVAYLTAASVVALRRALTASIEVQMSVKYAKNGMSNHQELMMNLAKTAAQQAGKQAKSATSKSLACERVIKLALKYAAQSNGANLNHVANRIVMDTLSLATLAKSMAFVSSDIAINSLYQATDVKPPT